MLLLLRLELELEVGREEKLQCTGRQVLSSKGRGRCGKWTLASECGPLAKMWYFDCQPNLAPTLPGGALPGARGRPL
jgi:hypothetical protein